MKKFILVVSFFSAIVMFNGCNFTTAKIQDVKICNDLHDNACDSDHPTLSIDDPEFYISCSVMNAPSDTKVKFSWYYTTGERIEIDAVTVHLEEGGSLPVYSSLSAPYAGWPDGDYEVIIQIEGHEDKTVVKTFTVR